MGLFDQGTEYGGDYGGGGAEALNFGDFSPNLDFNFEMPDFGSFDVGPLEGGAPYGAGEVSPWTPGQEYGPWAGGGAGIMDQWGGGGGLGAGAQLALGSGPYATAPGSYGFASPESGHLYDTTSGMIQAPSGQEFSPQELLRGAQQIEGQVGYQSGGGSSFIPTGQPGQPQASTAEQQGLFGGLEKFLGSNIGRAIVGGGVGLAGLGAARAIAGGPNRLQMPTYTPSASTVAGQNALAPALQAQIGREARAAREQNPAERALRMQALGLAPGLLQQGGGMVDPVQAALQQEVLSTLQNPQGGVSPATNQRQEREEQELRNRLSTQLGRDYELTTPGIQALNELRQRQNAERFLERQATIARISPLEESRLSGGEARRRAALGDVLGVSQGLGRPGFGQAIGYFGSPEQANQINLQLGSQAALEGFKAKEQDRQSLAQGLGGVAGTVGGILTERRSPFEDFFNSKYSQAFGFGK